MVVDVCTTMPVMPFHRTCRPTMTADRIHVKYQASPALTKSGTDDRSGTLLALLYDEFISR